jgi:DNA-binding HxlR family transcriptional regulator
MNSIKASQRTYHTQRGCPVAATLDVVGDRWTMLILRDLFSGRSGKYKDLMKSLRGISPNLLAQRLKHLMAHGVLERFFYSEYPPRAEYRLTERGKELGPILRTMADWGCKYELDDKARAAWRAP